MEIYCKVKEQRKKIDMEWADMTCASPGAQRFFQGRLIIIMIMASDRIPPWRTLPQKPSLHSAPFFYPHLVFLFIFWGENLKKDYITFSILNMCTLGNRKRERESDREKKIYCGEIPLYFSAHIHTRFSLAVPFY